MTSFGWQVADTSQEKRRPRVPACETRLRIARHARLRQLAQFHRVQLQSGHARVRRLSRGGPLRLFWFDAPAAAIPGRPRKAGPPTFWPTLVLRWIPTTT